MRFMSCRLSMYSTPFKPFTLACKHADRCGVYCLKDGINVHWVAEHPLDVSDGLSS